MTSDTVARARRFLECAPQTPHLTSKNIMKRSFFAVAAFSLLAFSAHAQQASGNLMGNGTPGDKVAVSGEGTGYHREVAIAENGKWMIRQVPIGAYVVTIKHADGSEESPKGIAVRAGSTARVK